VYTQYCSNHPNAGALLKKLLTNNPDFKQTHDVFPLLFFSFLFLQEKVKFKAKSTLFNSISPLSEM